MRQRASIVRALIHDPPILLMDEPFGALDALTREQMRIDLEALWLASGKTVLFVAHSIDEAVLLADRVIVMSRGPAGSTGSSMSTSPVRAGFRLASSRRSRRPPMRSSPCSSNVGFCAEQPPSDLMRRALMITGDQFRGIVAAPFLPMLPDHSIDRETLGVTSTGSQRPTLRDRHEHGCKRGARPRPGGAARSPPHLPGIDRGRCPLFSGLIAGSTRMPCVGATR